MTNNACDQFDLPDHPQLCDTACEPVEVYNCLNHSSNEMTEYYTWAEEVKCSSAVNGLDPEECHCETFFAGDQCVHSYLEYYGWTGELYAFFYIAVFLYLACFTLGEIVTYLNEEYDINLNCLKTRPSSTGSPNGGGRGGRG